VELAGRTAVVTGSGSGIGRGMALAFAEARMSLVLADLDTNAARRVAEEVRRLGTRALVVETDVGSRASVEALAEAAYALTGEVHLLCNNAGVTTFGTLGEIPYDDWRWVLQVNLFGVIHGLQSFLPRMRTQRGPKHVVNTASIAGCAGLPGLAAYCASKHAVVGISETLAREGAAWGLGCTVVCPGNTHTRIAESERNRPPEMGERRPTADVVSRPSPRGWTPSSSARSCAAPWWTATSSSSRTRRAAPW